MKSSSRMVRVFSLVAALAGITGEAHFAQGEAAGKISLPAGFKSELVYEVPLDTQGSWISLAVDDKGRLIASDEAGKLYRVSPSPVGAAPSETKVEPLQIGVGMAHGLLFHNKQLYVMQNGRVGNFDSGLYRASDSNGDDQFDRVEQLRVFKGAGEHGPHAVILGPDGKSLYFCAGNHTLPPMYSRSLVPPVWREDQLLPRIFDPRGHANSILPPGGWIARTDLNGNQLEIFSVGYRNMFDIAFNGDGELFTFDSDMEWDIGTPWYRPTRINHVTSGTDMGWRSGNGVWPEYFLDTVPTVVDAGPGSPTGIVFGKGTKFPEKYQHALFAGDWSYGRIYAMHFTPSGSSYRGEVEPFAHAMPLGVTDIVVRPQDGALYFAVGGRHSASAIYRIVYDGAAGEDADQASESTRGQSVAAPMQEERADAIEARELRQTLEKLHTGPQAGAVDMLWPHLSSSDRFINNAARAALEHQPFSEWKARALAETNIDAKITALAAYARSADSSQQAEWVPAVCSIKFGELDNRQRLNLLRAAGLGVMRLEPLGPNSKKQLLAAFDPHYPVGDHYVDRELAAILVRLRAPKLIERLLVTLENAATQQEGIDAAMALSAITEGWTLETRTQLLNWFDESSKTAGGLSFFGYLVSARDRFIAAMPASDLKALDTLISKPMTEAAPEIAAASRPVVKEWTLDELVEAVEKDAGPRNFENGRKMFGAAGCFNCHRVWGAGSSIGPDLTGVGGRFGVRDLLRSIVEPSAVISDQYQQMVFESNGRIIVGRITNLSNEQVHVSTNMLDPKRTEVLRRDEIDDQHPSDVSVMPAGLLNTLSQSEILDLMAFLRSGGNPQHRIYTEGPTSVTAAAGGK